MGRTARNRQLRRRRAAKNFLSNDVDLYGKLKSWMLSKNWKATYNLIPHVFETTGRGLMTEDKIEANQVVLQIPKSLLITTSVVAMSPIMSLFSSERSYTAQCVLATFLIYEKHLGHVSQWKPYLDTLPISYSNPEFCTKSEKKVLPHFIANDLNAMSKKLKYDYLSLLSSIKALHNSICNHCKQAFFKIFSYHKFAWAYYTVNTRAIYLENKKCSINITGNDNLALAPYLDLFNHMCENVADAQLVSCPNGDELYQIKTLKSYDAKMQVFINYGAHSNHKLYLEYGFFIPKNILDQIFFNISDIEKCHQASILAYEFIKSNNIDKSMAFTVEGLNYNAKNALFIVTSNILKETFWKEKIYCDEYNSKDLQLINQLGLTIIKNINSELKLQYANMKKIRQKSTSFFVAVNYVKECIALTEQSLKSIELCL